MSNTFCRLVSKITLALILVSSIIYTFSQSLETQALGSFNPERVFPGVLDKLPSALSSPSLINAYLAGKNSFLANYKITIGFEPNDTLVGPNTFSGKPVYLKPRETVQSPWGGKTMSVGEFIFRLSVDDFGNSCNLDVRFNDTCINNRKRIINPAFIIALIQKESGLIYGSNAQRNPNDSGTQFLIDRATGYLCLETQDKSKSCWDENPNWKFFKGFFRQVYYGVRFLRLWEQVCESGGPYFTNSNGVFKVGNTVKIRNDAFQFQDYTLRDGMTCAMAIYTPTIARGHFNIFKQIGGDVNLIDYKRQSFSNVPVGLPVVPTKPEEKVLFQTQKR